MLEKLFISEVRVKILTLLLRDSEEKLHVREIVRRVGAEINAVRRELGRLTRLGLLKRQPVKNRLYYRVNRDFVLYPELLGLVAKEVGLGKAILERRKELGEVEFAVLSRGLVQGRAATPEEVDLLLVGKIDTPSLTAIVQEAEAERGHEINYTVMDRDEFEYRRSRKDPFLMKVLMQPRIVLIGDESQFCRFD